MIKFMIAYATLWIIMAIVSGTWGLTEYASWGTVSAIIAGLVEFDLL